jgi:hypothetical protein
MPIREPDKDALSALINDAINRLNSIPPDNPLKHSLESRIIALQERWNSFYAPAATRVAA